LRLGLHLPQDGVSFEHIRSVALEAEDAGLASFWLLDHLHASPRADSQFLECWTVLSALAAETKKIRLGALVLNINNRNPALVAKMATTLDQISNGRLEFGVGAGGVNRAKLGKEQGFEYEFVAYNIPFPRRPSVRIKKLDEGLEIIKRMWTQDRTTFTGRYYSVKDAICLPRPVQKPRIPIWVGGMSGVKMVPVVAKHADVWNMMRVTTIEDYRSGLKKLREACIRIERDPDEIKTSIAFSGPVDTCRSDLEKIEKEGLDLAILRPPRGQEIKYIRELAKC
jgi:alkanesulfonate monooxygenase SsuD/methylene tetrahydromethanopterin reductase-like flavin-dependent oxidoreductase (luciferase family)